jgi:hypothetical protein
VINSAPALTLAHLKTAQDPEVNAQAMGNLQQLALGTAGLGGLGAGLLGLYRHAMSSRYKPERDTKPLVLTPRIAREEEEEEEEEEMLTDLPPIKAAALADAKPFANYSDMPSWYPGAYAATGAAGLGGGWKLVQWLMKQRRKSERDAEISGAKKEYASALREMYGEKAGEADSISVQLDAVFDSFEKEAQPHPPPRGALSGAWEGAGNIASGAWEGLKDKLAPAVKNYTTFGLMTPAVLSALGFGYLAYKNQSQRSKAKALREAMRRRRLELAARRPSQLTVELEEEE